jgi:hypothetical protein
VAAAAASPRPLFFPAAFVDLDGEAFILQVQSVFTRIRSGATLKALGGSALRSTTAAVCAGSGSTSDGIERLQLEWVKTPKGFWLLFISQTSSATAGWISPHAADSAAARDPSHSTS